MATPGHLFFSIIRNILGPSTGWYQELQEDVSGIKTVRARHHYHTRIAYSNKALNFDSYENKNLKS